MALYTVTHFPIIYFSFFSIMLLCAPEFLQLFIEELKTYTICEGGDTAEEGICKSEGFSLFLWLKTVIPFNCGGVVVVLML